MKQSQIQFSLPVSIIREDKSFIAYTPALDISTAGDTLEEAKERFEELVEIFFEEIIEKGTIEQVLTDLGWKKQAKTFVPPTVISHTTETFSIPTPIN